MANQWAVALLLALASAGLTASARAAAGVPPASQNDFGVLDQLTPSTVPALDVGDGRRSVTTLSSDPIAVPTPTAAQSGIVVLATFSAWRLVRRLLRRGGGTVAAR